MIGGRKLCKPCRDGLTIIQPMPEGDRAPEKECIALLVLCSIIRVYPAAAGINSKVDIKNSIPAKRKPVVHGGIGFGYITQNLVGLFKSAIGLQELFVDFRQ